MSMTTEERRSNAESLGLSGRLCIQIEEYVKWKLDHSDEETAEFQRVRANLFGDSSLPWTAVQVYIAYCVHHLHLNTVDKRRVLSNIALNNCNEANLKIKWFCKWGLFYLR